MSAVIKIGKHNVIVNIWQKPQSLLDLNQSASVAKVKPQMQTSLSGVKVLLIVCPSSAAKSFFYNLKSRNNSRPRFLVFPKWQTYKCNCLKHHVGYQKMIQQRPEGVWGALPPTHIITFPVLAFHNSDWFLYRCNIALCTCVNTVECAGRYHSVERSISFTFSDILQQIHGFKKCYASDEVLILMQTWSDIVTNHIIFL